MNRRSTSMLPTAAAACFALLLPGCGGGGSTPHVNPRPTPSGSPPPSIACTPNVNVHDAMRRSGSSVRHTSSVNPSAYTFSSNPQGLSVFINGHSVGTTVLSTTPPFGNQPNIGAIRGPQADYVVCFAQGADGPHTIFYNTAADTSGRLTSIGAANQVRSAAARTHIPAAGIRIAPRVHPASGRTDRLRIQVRFSAASIQSDERLATEIERREGATRGQTLGPIHAGVMNRIVWIPRGETPESFAARFRKHGEVVDARPLPLRYAQSSAPVFPNDTFYDPVNQWDLSGAGTAGLVGAPNAIGAPYAWGYTTGKRSTQVAIIDTGADLTHPDLAAQSAPLGPKISYQVRWVGSEPPYPDRNAGAAQDQDGHGTNVSGIAAADTGNNYGLAGTGFNVGLQIYRIFPTPVAPGYSSNPGYGASTADEAAAIFDAMNHRARVINLSLGSCEGQGSPPGPDPTEFDAVEAAISAGVVVVAAAGNERSGQGGSACPSANTIDFPAAYPGVISAGATSLRDGGSQNPNAATEYVASYSNSGPGLSVVAPGGDPSSNQDPDLLHWVTNLYSITVADPSLRCQPIPGISPPLCVAQFAGTSQATPHVSGVAALMVSANPALGPGQVKRILEATADNINDPNQGHGRVDAYRALAAVVHDTTQVPPPTASNFVAIAYTVTVGSNKPNILNQTFTSGVPLRTDATWRIADVGPSAPSFEIGLWFDNNGNGIVDAGDYFGNAGPCSGTAPCSAAAAISVTPVPPGFVLK